jgi:hypothetical protein
LRPFATSFLRCSMFSVQCSMFPSSPQKPHPTRRPYSQKTPILSSFFPRPTTLTFSLI